ncbi:MAG: aminotransferase class I/II-fold pyridoxal phosphate-dependent enzyme [Mariprofundaceae bacterium]
MRRIDTIEPFRVMQLLERAKELEAQGQHIIHMEIGEPDFPMPDMVLQAAKTQLDQGDQFYTPSTGLPALQKKLAAWYMQEYDVQISPDRILITPGTSGAFSTLYAALLDPAESVLLPDPGYPCQRNFIRLAGGEPINIPVGPDTSYHLNAKHIHQHWQAKSRAAIVISPGNPTGTIMASQDLEKIANACREQGGYLISDEIYHGLHYGNKPGCALQFSNDAIVVNGFSKRWAMTGWRVGWMVVPEQLIEPCRRIMQNIFIAAPTLSQHLAIAALDANKEVELMRKAYDERRKFLLSVLPPLGFDIVVEPQGAFYIYANVEALTDDSRNFCWSLLENIGVAITPGEDFGSYRAEQHLRFSYATSMENLQEGVARLKKWLG